MAYDKTCSGCAISQGLLVKPGGLLKLPGGWIVDQYAGGEGFLGWLALQPDQHRMSVSQLSSEELAHLGPNVAFLDRTLTSFWHARFADDPVERVYFVYFFELEFEVPRPKEMFHLHVHIIPRFRSLAKPLELQSGRSRWPNGWAIAEMVRKGAIRTAYTRQSGRWETDAGELIDHLRREATSL